MGLIDDKPLFYFLDADPACVFPLRLPVGKLQDPENPIPGAIMIEATPQEESSLAASPSLVYDVEANQVIGGSIDVDKVEKQVVGKLVEIEISKKGKRGMRMCFAVYFN